MTTYLEQSLIEPNPYQPRLDMDPVALNRLAEDIKTNGLLQAPAVRPIMGGRYQIIFGHRRAAAWKIAHGDSPLPYFRSTLTLTPAIGARLLDRESYAIGELFGKKHRDDLEKNLKANKATQPQIVDSLIGTLIWEIADNAGPSWFRDYKPECAQKVRDALADFAHQCKVKLPAGWDSRLTSTPVATKPAAKPKRK